MSIEQAAYSSQLASVYFGKFHFSQNLIYRITWICLSILNKILSFSYWVDYLYNRDELPDAMVGMVPYVSEYDWT